MEEGVAVAVTLEGVVPDCIVDTAIFLHPFASVPVTVKVVLEAGLANTLEPFVVFIPVEGLHE
jgi:hypothetical protein